MSDFAALPSNEVDAVRAKLMEDLAPIEIYAAAIDKCPRTVRRMIAVGKVPIVKIGHTPYVVISRARELQMAEATIRHRPVRRGRPVDRAA